MKTFTSLLVVAIALSGCTSYDVHRNGATRHAATQASHVQILYNPPNQQYESIGIVSVRKYKPGFTDPTISDAIPKLQAAGAELGADAVLIMQSRAMNDRYVTVEGDAIRFTTHEPSPQHHAQPQAAPPAGGDGMVYPWESRW